MEDKICDFGCGQRALYKFDNGRWCCSKHVNQCPVKVEQMKQHLIEHHKNSHSVMMRQLAESGRRKCHYCGGTAKFWLGKGKGIEDRFGCTERAKDCPAYKEFVKQTHLKKYRENPEFLEWQRENVKRIAQRPEVQEKKSDTMIHLHRDDCEKCKEFQEKFKQGHIERVERMMARKDES